VRIRYCDRKWSPFSLDLLERYWICVMCERLPCKKNTRHSLLLIPAESKALHRAADSRSKTRTYIHASIRIRTHDRSVLQFRNIDL